MDIKEIIKIYGTHADYYDFNTGRIYAITKAKYDSETNETTIPVINDDASDKRKATDNATSL
jgi:hypothetical protein